jgi:amino acid transporter
MAIAAVGTLVNTYGAKFLPPLEGIILGLHLFGFVAVLVPIWVMSPGQTPSSEVWTVFGNEGGWSSIGLACLVGQLTPIFSWTGPDAATHMGKRANIDLKYIRC